MERNGRHKSMSQEKDNNDDDDDEEEEGNEEEMEQREDEVDDEEGGHDRVKREEDKIFGKDEDDGRRTKTSSSDKKHYKCKYAVENSSRFSLRVIEAMRSLQRHENVLPISSLNEIVDYIGKNYNNDGDLYAQVRTAMKQLLKEGFVVEVLNDEYQLIGPFPIGVMLEDCDCRTDRTKTRFDTAKHYKSKERALSRKKRKDKSLLCSCEGTNENEKELDGIDGKDRNKDVSLSFGSNHYDSNETTIRTPFKRRRSLRLRRRVDDDNCDKYIGIGRTTVKRNDTNTKGSISCEDRRERSVRNVHDDTDDNEPSVPTFPSKRTRRRDDDDDDDVDLIKNSCDVRNNRDINNASNDDHRSSNDRSRDSVFQELKGSIPVTSKSHEMELKKWIQRCRRECERQNKR